MAAVCALGASACQGDGGSEQEELQALLHDEPLGNLPPGVQGGASKATGAVLAATGDGGVNVPPDGGVSQPPTQPPVGSWSFDDCNPFRTNLSDSTFNGNTAFRSVGVTCTTGIQNQGVSIAVKEDIVYVPDQPNFTFENGVTVAGWFKPTTAGGTRTLFRKRDKDTSSFALLMNGGKFQFVASLGDGRAISVTSPKKVKANVFQHVAGTYDNQTLRLYVDGVEVTSFDVPGTIPPGPGPLLMGNDGSERRFNGVMDNTTFATHALNADEILQLTCFPSQPTVVISPTTIPPTAPGVAIPIDIAMTNNNPASCQPITFTTFTFGNVNVDIDPPAGVPAFTTVASGQTAHQTVTATVSESADGGSFASFQMEIIEPTTNFFIFPFFSFEVTDPPGCHVTTARELMIKNVSVVDDPLRTQFDPTSTDPRNGVWSFKHLMEAIAPTPADAPDMVEAMMTSLVTTQTVNGFSIGPRPGAQPLVLDVWPRTPDGKLDLAQAPLRLQAIVDRFDLRNLANGDAGEGRFVFAFNFQNGFPLQATMIFEYKLPAATDDDVVGWANAFHGLGALQFGEDYNAALQAITERFAARGARPGHVNDSAINAVRTNEIDFSDNGIWQLREFNLSAASGRLEPATIKLTPDRSFNNTQTLADYINGNQAAIIAETHTVPDIFQGQPFQAGAVFNDLSSWFAPGVDPEARFHFSLNTCNGCHSAQETNTVFLQITPRFPGNEAQLSSFLTGTTVFDPVTGQQRNLNDLARRKADLTSIVCNQPGKAQLRKGISRVH